MQVQVSHHKRFETFLDRELEAYQKQAETSDLLTPIVFWVAQRESVELLSAGRRFESDPNLRLFSYGRTRGTGWLSKLAIPGLDKRFRDRSPSREGSSGCPRGNPDLGRGEKRPSFSRKGSE